MTDPSVQLNRERERGRPPGAPFAYVRPGSDNLRVNRIRMVWRRLRGGTTVKPRAKHLGDPPTRYDDAYARRAQKVQPE